MEKYSSQLIIRNFGAIKDVDITLNQVNVIIGNQSSGKSTIAKVLSFCQWVEKRYIIDGKFHDTVEEALQRFHRIGNEYFSKDTYIEYNTKAVKISFDAKKDIIVNPKNESTYYKSKNIYIPAERNFATTIPNLGRYNETNDNIMNFLYDWNEAKKEYRKDKEILNLGIAFSFDEKSEEEDYIRFIPENGKSKEKMLLRLSSSGLQSVIPLYILFDYLTDIFYKKNKPLSINENSKINVTNFMIHDILKDFNYEIKNDIITFNLNDSDSKTVQKNKIKIDSDKLKKIISEAFVESVNLRKRSIIEYHFSKLIIEEPEQNLYPRTQKDLIYHILKVISKSRKRKHQLLMTTHSPFILYSLNNCMMGYQVKSKMPKEEQQELESSDSWIDPRLVSVWHLNKGRLNSIVDEDTKVIGAHSFNDIMNSVTGEYFEMLNYFGDAE